MSAPTTPSSIDSGFYEPEAREDDMYKLVHRSALQRLKLKFHGRNSDVETLQSLGTSQSGIPLQSVPESESHDNENLQLSDIPEPPTQRPAFGKEYKRHIDELRLYYDYDSSSFRRPFEVLPHLSDSWFEIQMRGHQIEPFIEFGSLGFQFKSADIEDELRKILLICGSFEQHKKDYITVKIKSIEAIYLLTNGMHSDGNNLLHELETKVAYMQDCDLTAWFYVASFWSLAKDMNRMKYTGSIRKHYKTRCLSQLQKARAGFVASGSGFEVEAVITIWWMFLTQADLTKIATGQVLKPVQNEDLAVSEKYLYEFLRQSKKVGFPCDELKHEKAILIFERSILPQSSDRPLTCEGEDDGDDELLEEIYYDFISRIDGEEPNCIQQISRNEEDGKIYIFTTEESDELVQFLKKHNADTAYFAIRKGGGITLFHPDSEGVCKALVPVIVRNTIGPGAVLFKVPHNHWEQNQIPRKMEDLLKQESLDMLGMCTLGGFITNVSDSNPENKQILTSGHTFNDKLETQMRLSFLSAHTDKTSGTSDETERVLFEVSNRDYTGRYGGEKISDLRGCRVLVDAIVINIHDAFDQVPHVDMKFKHDGVPMSMGIYDGNLDDLLGMKVSMYGCISGLCLGQGTIVHTNVEGINIPKKGLCSGLLAIDLNPEYRTGERVRIAAKGDSGAIIFGENAQKQDKDTHPTHVAIGLVLGKNNGPCWNKKRPEKCFEHVTYCTALKYVKSYFKTKDKEIEIYSSPSVQNDSGYLSGPSNPVDESDLHDEPERQDEFKCINETTKQYQDVTMKSAWSLNSFSSTDSQVSMGSLGEQFTSSTKCTDVNNPKRRTKDTSYSSGDGDPYEASEEDVSAEEDIPTLVDMSLALKQIVDDFICKHPTNDTKLG